MHPAICPTPGFATGLHVMEISKKFKTKLLGSKKRNPSLFETFLKYKIIHGCRLHSFMIVYVMSKIFRLASQFATQNCLGCYSKLNLGSKFHAEVASHLPHTKIRTLYTLNIIL